ncbi:UPF0271 protein [Propionispira arboris]|uniref:5-oxoprolinase subunit A n=1 Tax=Propionispira arboris TaxID=84035 RepID=A0A1H6WWX7_9FIRM|nr:5-oxoprolinase subunit PxpA [Propionispira arboris]SEJ19804.1 UPF0271 protein [Propionispira arboris]
MYQVDLNCDLGESFGSYTLGLDQEILPFVTSVNIACGFHAGDPAVMHKTVELALKNNVAIGAHPGLPDLNGFGRRVMDITAREAYDMVLYQVGALQAFVKAAGGILRHVKPHGALYNMAAKNSFLAEGIAEAIYKLEPELILFGLSGSEIIKAGERIGLRTASEVFADRTYQSDGSLTSRQQMNALITNEQDSIEQVLGMVTTGSVLSRQGSLVHLKADTICIHGDGAKALLFARKIRGALLDAKVSIRAVKGKIS